MPAPARASSYACGTSHVPLRYETIGQALEKTVGRYGDHEALVVRHQGVRWNWAELGRRVDTVAASFIAAGLQVGDRIGIWSPNCAEWVVTQLAAAKAGLILVTINPAYRTSELEHALTLSGCRVLVLADRFKTSDYAAMLLNLAPELAQTGGKAGSLARLPQLQLAIQVGEGVQPGLIGFDELRGVAAMRRDSCSRTEARSCRLTIRHAPGTRLVGSCNRLIAASCR